MLVNLTKECTESVTAEHEWDVHLHQTVARRFWVWSQQCIWFYCTQQLQHSDCLEGVLLPWSKSWSLPSPSASIPCVCRWSVPKSGSEEHMNKKQWGCTRDGPPCMVGARYAKEWLRFRSMAKPIHYKNSTHRDHDARRAVCITWLTHWFVF